MKKVKALVLLSGGLDSMLAAKLLLEQGVEVAGITFISNFFGAAKARKAAEQLGIRLLEHDFREEHLAMVKQPAHGYGSNMNPCIDCHALMLTRARELMERDGFDLVATGEVLGQRPMSQNLQALAIVAKISGIGDRLVRPLSAKLLDETMPEKTLLVDRNKLLDISGRSRKRQVELAARYGIKDYPSPAGGCLLTDPGYSKKLKELFTYWPECQGGDTEIIKHGRVFWLTANSDNGEEKILLLIGRDQADNEALQKSAKSGDIIVELADENGPTALIRFKDHELILKNWDFEIIAPENINFDRMKLNEHKSKDEIISTAALLAGYYAAKLRGKKVKIKITNKT